ncbi:MAG: CCA tRNA nucleotidyltransferase [Velocimicrobium sp.]
MCITLPEKVEYILDTLMEHGYEAYAVGGCVRDTILGRTPGDWDITTSAKPQEVKSLFPRTLDTGIQHGTVTIMIDKEGFEVTTYRIDGEYEDNRHPKSVAFTSNLFEDLKRRDFTINAMAYNSKIGLVDAFDGNLDIKQKRIRCVGNPKERFHEDALRMLRAVRFAAQLGFIIDDSTKDSIALMAPTLEKVSQERVRVELDKLLLAKDPLLLVEAFQMKMTKVVLPEFDFMMMQEQKNPYHIYSVGMHVLKAVEECNNFLEKNGDCIAKDFPLVDKKLHSILCWTLLLHDVGKPCTYSRGNDGMDHFYGHADKSAQLAKTILGRLKFDNSTIDLAVRLIKWHNYSFFPSASNVRKAASKIGPDIMESLFFVQRMDIYAKNPVYQEEKIAKLDEVISLYQQIKDRKECLTLKQLAVNGGDLMEIMGIQRGPSVGASLNELLNYVLENPEENNRESLLKRMKKQ